MRGLDGYKSAKFNRPNSTVVYTAVFVHLRAMVPISPGHKVRFILIGYYTSPKFMQNSYDRNCSQ